MRPLGLRGDNSIAEFILIRAAVLPDRPLDDQLAPKRADVSKAKRGVTNLLKRRRLDRDCELKNEEERAFASNSGWSFHGRCGCGRTG